MVFNLDNGIKNKILNYCVIFFSIVFLFLSIHRPTSINSFAAGDDALFINHGLNILHGDWLGKYNNLTLFKGSGFSLFLTLNSIIGLPITLTISFFYLLSLIVFARVCSELKVNHYIVFLGFIFALFHPALAPTRIIRDFICPAAFFLSFSGIVYLAFVSPSEKYDLKKVILFGFCFGFMLITREDWAWIYPGFAIIVIAKLMKVIRQKNNRNIFLTKIGVFGLSTYLIICLVSTINFFQYGSYINVDVKDPEFERTLKNLYSVQVGKDREYLAVPLEKRNVIYEVSPSFSELREYFEKDGLGWTEHGCRFYPSTCGDYSTGWFMWALRDAVASRGYYVSPQESSKFYHRINEEIEAACFAGKVICKSNPLPFVPNFSLKKLYADLFELFPVLYKLVDMSDHNLDQSLHNSYGSKTVVNRFIQFLGRPVAMPLESEEEIHLSGWYYHKGASKDWINVSCESQLGNKNEAPSRFPSSDLVTFFSDKQANQSRFDFSIKKNAKCIVNTELEISKMIDSKSADFIFSNSAKIHFDQIKVPKYQYMNASIKIRSNIIELYHRIVPFLSFIGLLSFATILLGSFLRAIRMDSVTVLILSMWILLLSRLVLIFMVHATSFPAFNSIYLAVAYPLICLASILSIGHLYVKLPEFLKERK